MTSFRAVVEYMTAEPFRPFRITATGGRTYDVLDPDAIQVGRIAVTLFTPMGDDPELTADRRLVIPLDRAESVEPLGTPRPQMGPSQDILNYLRATPFRPFRIHMTGGKTFDIRHPEMVKVGRGTLIVFSFVSDDPEIFDRWDTGSLTLIENMTHTDAPVA